MKSAVKRLVRGENGQALMLTLILLVIGMIVLAPTLNFIGTGLISGRLYEQKIDEIYAADAGVEDALWHIRYTDPQGEMNLIQELLGEDYDEYDYSTPYDYPYDLDINGKNVSVSIQNVWIPKDIDTPDAEDARDIIEDEKLIIVGYPSSSASTYTIKIVYFWDTTQHRDALRVETIGIWLSPGFEYDGGCSLESRPFYSAPTVSLYKGGQAVVWNFASQPRLRQDFEPTADTSNPTIRTFTFQYTGPEGQIPELVSSWVDTTGVTGITYSWDDSIRLYKIVSEAGGVEIEAYGARTKFRKLKSTISSDYAITGNTWMEATGTGQTGGCSFPSSYYRDRLYAETGSNILRIGIEEIPESGLVPPGKIPEEAIIEQVRLYWTGWIDPYYWYSWQWYGKTYYSWSQITGLQYPNSPTPANLQTLVETNAKVNKVKLDVDGNAQTITADKYQVSRTQPISGDKSWAYSCYKDVTDVVVSGGKTVREYLEEAMKSDNATGAVTFTVGHADEIRGDLRGSPYQNYNFPLYDIGQSTGYPLATPAHMKYDETCYQMRYNYTYAGWSLIVFYRSPTLKQRQLVVFDDFLQVTTTWGEPYHDVNFDISGFLAPPVLSEEDKNHLTYFVGEGDAHFVDSKIGINIGKPNGAWLHDPGDYPNPENNVFNSLSNAIPVTESDGIDTDTFELPQGTIMPYDALATVKLRTTQEIYFLVYLIVSFRSDLTTGGIITNYTISF